MPELSRFFGIIIRMYYDDHPPPHFHAFYGDLEMQVGIDPITILNGRLPRRAVSIVVARSAIHKHELLEKWQRLIAEETVVRIDPLD